MPAECSVLFLGDIIGQPGMRAVVSSLSTLVKRFKSDFVIVNAENACDGFGIDHEIVAKLFHAGVSAVTTGNHVWHRQGVEEVLEKEERVLRPDNYPPGVPGSGVLHSSVKGIPITVINLQGRRRMLPVDCPFRGLRDILKKDHAKISIVDFHAEDTNEKEAMGYFAKGKVSLVCGTHTHVQTADARILGEHTGYITDLGACCALNGIIGFESVATVEMSKTQVPIDFRVLDEAATICGVSVKISVETGACKAIESFSFQSSV